MKKFILLCCAFLLCACGKENSTDVLKDLEKSVSNSKSYKVIGNMEISNDEEVFTYSLESYYLKDDYYKVILVNQTNNHEQIILKNKDDVYVITPLLNKSFKFQSEWPNNSSQAYLLGSIVNDIKNDKDVEVSNLDKGYVIKAKVNYPNNEELKYQKVYLNSKKKIEKVEVYNDNDIIKIKATFENIDLKANLKEKDFNLKDYVKEVPENTDANTNQKNENTQNNTQNNNQTQSGQNTQNPNAKCDGSDETCKNEQNNVSENSNTNTEGGNKTEESANIENIIYPLYIPSNTHLKSSETIKTENGNRVILTFSGDKNFVLIEEASVISNDMEIVPVYGEPLMLSEAIGALSANSLSWDVGKMSYYLASTELTVSEMMSIANSLGNETLVANTK